MDVNLKKLEYDKILEILSKYCVTYIGKELARNLRPSNSKEEVQEMLDETFEAVNLSYRNSMPGFYEIDSIDIEVKNLESNNTLSCKSLINLKNIDYSLSIFFFNSSISSCNLLFSWRMIFSSSIMF